MRSRLIVTGLCVSLLALPGFAQEQSGAIQGVIKDAQGGVLPGASVEARNVNAAGTTTAISNTAGIYRFPALPPGTYEITATLAGFSPQKVENVRVVLGQLLTIDFTLPVAAVAETIQVTAESPIIDVRQNANAVSLSSETIDRIPKGRDFTTVIAYLPGSNAEARVGGTSIDGASGSENRFIVDGVDTTNLQTGVSGKTVVYDFIGEVQVKTSGYAAEFPGATGGVVSAITKTGSNVFHGGAGFYYTNNNEGFWNGTQRPTLRLKPTNTKLMEYVTYPLDAIPEWSPVVDVGGPIFKDRLWFYGGYAPVRTSTTRTVTFTDNNRTQTFKRNEPTDRVTLNLSWQASNALRVKFSYNPTWSKQRGGLPSIQPDGTSTDVSSTDFASTGSNNWNNSYAGSVDWLVAQRWFVNVSGGYFYYDQESLGNGTTIRHQFDSDNYMFPDIPPDLRQISGYYDAKSSNKIVRDLQGRYMLNATSTWYLSAKGEHALKAGVRFERIKNDRYRGQIQPTIYFCWDCSYTDSAGKVSRGKYGYYYVTNNVIGIGDVHSDNWGLFVQDSWSISNRLTLNLGVRTESEAVPFYSPGSAGSGNAIDFGFGDKIAPRVGFAFDVRGDGKWKAYGSFGRYFDITKLEMPRGSLGGEKWLEYFWTLDTYDWKSINCQEGTTGCPGTFLEQVRLRFGSNEIDPETAAVMTKYFGAPRNLLQDDMKPVQSQEAIIGLDHELGPSTSLGVRYVHKWVTRTIEDFGWNEGGTEYYFIGNPGEGYIGRQEFLWGPGKLYQTGTPAYMPKPVRDYDAVEVALRKRLSRNWTGTAVYTWSRLYGNFPGLASSDEVGASGNARTSPNVNRMFDSVWMLYDDSGSRKPVLGLLNTDRPHYLKLQGTYDFNWGTGVGVNFYARSGALFSKQLSYQGYSPVFYDGRGSLGRTPMEQAFDLYVQHDFRFGGRYRLNVNLNVTNLFDNDVALSVYASKYRDRLTFSPIEAFFNGFDTEAVMNANPSRYRPDARFDQNYTFMPRRAVRLGMRFSF